MKKIRNLTKNFQPLFSLPQWLCAAIFSCTFGWGTPVPAAQENTEPKALASSMDELYRIVRDNVLADREVNQQRIEEFVKKRDQQRQLLQQESAAVTEQESASKQLNVSITANEEALAELEKQLNLKLGNFGELFGVTRQVAGDTRGQIQNSLISAEFPNRGEALAVIAASRELPSIDQLRHLWSVMLQEQIEQGRISRFQARVDNDQGLPGEEEVIRLGPFTAIANGKFLSSGEQDQQLMHLQAQPAAIFRRAARQVSDAGPQQLVNAVIDPSRGTILSLLIQQPDLMEQYHQGGLPGYLVTVLAVIGLAIGLQRLLSLWVTGLKVQRQIKNDQVDINNPLGRLLNTYEENSQLDIETLELKLEDAVLKEVPKLDRGLNTLKVLAAVAPLLGLLGTVIGMIVTFQTITLWGTGDPKLMADGISQALVTTVQGLVAAIPLLLLHSMANGRARVLQQILEEQSAGLIAAKAEASYERAI